MCKYYICVYPYFVLSFLSTLGHMDACMKTAIKLCEYDDVLDPKDVYSLLCLASLRCRFFGICSKAFVKVLMTCIIMVLLI